MPYHRLDVYQKAYQLALEVHRISLEFPQIEQYGLAQQLRASSKSIPVKQVALEERYQEVGRMLRGVIKRYDG